MAGWRRRCADGAKCSVIDGDAMSLRDKIADIIVADVEWHTDNSVPWRGMQAADAILKLPEIAQELEAAIPRAYQMGLDAGRGELLPVLEGLVGPYWGDAWYGEEEHDKPRAIQPPADLVQQVMKGVSDA